MYELTVVMWSSEDLHSSFLKALTDVAPLFRSADRGFPKLNLVDNA